MSVCDSVCMNHVQQLPLLYSRVIVLDAIKAQVFMRMCPPPPHRGGTNRSKKGAWCREAVWLTARLGSTCHRAFVVVGVLAELQPVTYILHVSGVEEEMKYHAPARRISSTGENKHPCCVCSSSSLCFSCPQ